MAQRYTRALQLGLLMATTQVSCAHAQAAERLQFDIPAQELKYALRTVTRRAGLELYATSSDLRGRTSPGVHGQLTVEEALDRLLAGTGLVARFKGKAVYIRDRPELAGGDEENAAPARDEIMVTGSRIRGAPPSAPVTLVRQVTMREQGLNDLGDVVRAIPQNFNGGQNPGVTFGVPGSQNVTSGSGLNLRGLGADATLTLLNGHRLAYDSATQAIDISAIPVAAVTVALRRSLKPLGRCSGFIEPPLRSCSLRTDSACSDCSSAISPTYEPGASVVTSFCPLAT